MIFDMHCHTREGSCDAIVSIEETILKLKSKGYNGMVVTDHNSYNGYKSVNVKPDDFLVLKGIEYDSLDSGHLLIILPHKINYSIFEYRGMKGQDVIDIVHKLGGIIGPAHPYDYFKLGVCNTKFKDNYDYLSQFDFIETFNGSLNAQTHIEAEHLARKLDKPCTGGSDSHSIFKVGFGQTIVDGDIQSEDDLIDVIKNGHFMTLEATGSFVNRKSIKLHNMSVEFGGFCYNMLNHCLPRVSKKHVSELKELIDELKDSDCAF